MAASASAASSTPSMELPADSVLVTCTGPVNIAVVKYWAKRDEKLILPVNDSLSGTIHQDTMKSSTTIIASKSFDKDQMWLNEEEEEISKSKRLTAVINQLRNNASEFKDEAQRTLIKKDEWSQYKLRIISHNNFPTAAGLASSASGFATLTQTLATLYGVQGDLSKIARMGSGSACRSMYGGWVKWDMGARDDGEDSIAVQVADENHWPEMRVLILVISSGPKEVSSTSGMQQTWETSDLIKYRASHVVPKRMKVMEEAIKARDFNTFAVETIKDSNQFHAVCLDTYPPIFYMNDTSKKVVHVIDSINSSSSQMKAAYTYDAGPNAVVYLLDKDLESMLATFLHAFQPADAAYENFVHDPMNLINRDRVAEAKQNFSPEVQKFGGLDASGVRRIIVSKVGPGPQVQTVKHSFA